MLLVLSVAGQKKIFTAPDGTIYKLAFAEEFNGKTLTNKINTTLK